MPKIERGMYEPSDERRVFDASEDEDEEEEGSRLPLLVVIALLVLAAFGGVVWLAYTQGLQHGREDAPRIITAQNSPTREAPDDASSDGTPNTGLKIYEQQAPDDDAATADDESDTAPPPPTETAKQQQPPPPATTDTQKKASETKNAETPPPTKAQETKPVKTAEAPVEKTPPPPTAATTPTATPAPVTAAGGYMLQLGASKTEDDAKTAWKQFQARHPIVGGYSPTIVKADLGDKGIWYRLRIGPFGDKAAATAFCGKLKADGGDCIPTK